ncbi:hypothetical protein CEXT_662231 [Caerostris extrusa]|uniref:Uncharacterized protein n=1 Tax=Caerostris extrusa TaxID=172846 RepID=A0AAV4XUH8_CAEEX|nr:hypothetical protein CEXT_662231 [Caerostris extrusa]
MRESFTGHPAYQHKFLLLNSLPKRGKGKKVSKYLKQVSQDDSKLVMRENYWDEMKRKQGKKKEDSTNQGPVDDENDLYRLLQVYREKPDRQ